MTFREAVLGYIYEALSRVVLRFFPRIVAEVLATVFGLWTAILPVLIWVAWSADVLYAVLLSGAISTTLYAVFAIATAPSAATSSFQQWKQEKAEFNSAKSKPSKSTWRDIS
ncbi:MAG: hypothetical protein AAGD43_09930 [Pseudomonadota bacterium]